MRALKTTGKILLGLIILVILLLVGAYFYIQQKYPVDKNTYPHYIGYIDQDKAQNNDVYSLCDKEAIYYIHHGAAEEAYSGSKKRFRETVLASYKNEGYTDSGYVNFRFLVTCEGNPGWFKTIQVDTDYAPTLLSKVMVEQLFTITAQPENWNSITVEDKAVDYYMYISYKIEHGEISEILP